jgi:3',5'-cyclic AMP phosphodiesterase CpdA
MTRLAHLSDLHFGRVEPQTLVKLRAAVDACEPDIVVVTGDLTQSGRQREFHDAAQFLKTLERPVVAVPGNHDVPVHHLGRRFFAPWRLFSSHIGSFAATCAEAGRAAVIGVNTARRAQPRFNWSYGRLRNRDIAAAVEKAAKAAAMEKLVFIAAHHPFRLSVGSAGSRIVGRGELGLKRFAESGVAAVMTGHVHVTSVAPVASTGDRILSIQAGTSASTRLRAEAASFLLIDCPSLSEIKIAQFAETGSAYAAAATFEFQRSDGIWRAA